MQSRATRLAERAKGVNSPFSAGATATSVWTPLGPAPLNSDASGFGFQDYGAVSGRATAVAVDPADPSGNTVYVGGAYGGVWKSENAAASSPASVIWTPLTDTQATLAVGSIAIQPGSSVVLVGTGETDSSLDSYYGLGILRSADAGNSWTLSTEDAGHRQFAGLGFSKIAFSTLQPDSVVAAAAGATQGVIDGLENPVSANRGLYHSNDGGQNWTYSSIQDGGVTIAPDSATSVVFTTVAGVGVFFAALRSHGFYSSPDGVQWTRLPNQPGGLSTFLCPPNPASLNCPIYRGELAVVPGREEMYAWYVDASDGDGGIWQTFDGGTHWKKLVDAGITNCGDTFGGCGTSQGSYNLDLAAVPNGGATDLYAGAINLYKCTISSIFPSCDPNFVPTPPADATFQNLTHVYGCPPDFGAIAHVHPDQHGIAFMQVSGSQVVMYFANDGGIYRALDGYSGLTTGSCSGHNQFESLNQTLGSMTQFVFFSQHPTDPGTILGGSQDNGSPATNMGTESSTQWLNVNSGDGGYNAINPANPTEWFTANTDVSIQRCTSGIACHAQDFTEVVSNATVGRDFGAFYTPYILDPQNSSELIVGTCRVWRGTTTGENFSVLSVDFETGGVGDCSGSEVNLVRSLAAGGIKDTNGFSNVIYAGTSGFGPLLPGGHLWVTTNASAGPGSWIDRTGSINPGGFPLSGVAVDTSDPTGNTAYVTIMGFGVPHVKKTIDAGVSWADFSGELTNALPDAPANAILVDPGQPPANGAVYVATDVGVFSSSTGSASWTEVGPTPDPLSNQQIGYLPNVAVTALGMFNSGGTRKLRASTYGRGMWEVTLLAAPDFAFDIPNSSTVMTVFAGQQAVFSGTLLALDGYNSTVDLTCTAAVTLAPPPVCLPAPTSLTPAIAPGTSFTINASSATAADYLLTVTGEGSDSNSLLRDSLLTLHVVDFNVTPPSPASLSVSQAAVSNPVSFQVTAAGLFNGTVWLSCTGLPAGAACSFLPSSSVNPTAAAWAAATMTVSTLANTPPGNYAVAIVANVTGAPSPKTQMLSLTVTPPGASGDFALSVSKASQTAPVNGSAIFNAALSSSAGYNSVVDLSCGPGAPLNCELSPASLTPTASGAAFTVRAGADVVRNYHFSVVGTGRDSAHTTHSQSLVLNVVFDFAVNNQSGSQSVPSGQQAHYNLDVRPLGTSAVFPDNVTLSCSGLPPLSTCSFSPSQVASGEGDNNVVLTIATMAPITASARLARIRSTALLSIWPLTGFVVVFAGFARGSRAAKNIVSTAGLLLIVSLGILQSGCGGLSGASGSGQPGTPPGAYQVTVAATLNTASGPLSRSVLIMLTVQ